MRLPSRGLLLAACLLLPGLPAAQAQTPSPGGPVPRQVGQCVVTTISSIGHRLKDARTGRQVAGSGSAVTYADGLGQIGYEELAAIRRARRGDRVRLCLTSIPNDCPANDDRGRVYQARDLRTRGSWSLPDSEHACGGA